MRIECPNGCGAMLTVDTPPPPPRPTLELDDAQIVAWREAHAETVGRVVLGAIIVHTLYGPCSAIPQADGSCGHISPMGHQCNAPAHHTDNHQRDLTDEAGNTRIVATWPRLEVVQ